MSLHVVVWSVTVFLWVGFVVGSPLLAHGQTLEKPRVAIKAPRAAEGFAKVPPTAQHLAILLAEMEASLRAARKFELLTRQEALLQELREEQRFAQSDLAKGDAAREGQFENADYFVIPVIQDFQLLRESRPVPNIPQKYFITDNGLLQLSAQILDTSTGQIKSTFSLRASFAREPRVANTPEGDEDRSILDFTEMAKAVSAQMADQLTDAVFPMVVLQVIGNQVWISRGADGGLKRGDVLTVYKPGAELVDPYTKERLGWAEIPIGEIKVTLVNPRSTTAEIITKKPQEAIEPGFIVRRSDQ